VEKKGKEVGGTDNVVSILLLQPATVQEILDMFQI
jgi:hypothetical protein